ncbi:KH domain-containing protein [Candidatus Gottesmanbacteria bacterium]|nr:KH domain-containing protein [Candidatus Gottesmanbacteria bacterium]
MTSAKTSQIVAKTAEELLKSLQITAIVKVSENEGVFDVNVETEESGLLIGHHGTTLYSFQFMIASIVYNKTKEWHKIIVNVGDYREKREESLKSLAQQYIQEAISSKQPVALPPLTPSERRIIHMYAATNPDVISESVGEGRDRRLTIKPKTV